MAVKRKRTAFERNKKEEVLALGMRRARVSSNASKIFFVMAILVLPGFLTYKRNMVWNNGITLWEDVAEKAMAKARPHNNLCDQYVHKGDYDAAMNECRNALNINPFHARAHNNLGAVFKKQGHLDDAIVQYRKAIEIEPLLPDAFNNLGVIYYEKGLLTESIEAYQEALKIKPMVEIYYNAAVALETAGNFPGAIERYEKFLALAPAGDRLQIERTKQRIIELKKQR